MCGISYPYLAQFQHCQIHDVATRPVDGDPDENWEAQYQRLIRDLDKDVELRSVIPRVRGVEVTVDMFGRLFVSQWALIHAGLRLSRMQGDQFYLFQLDDGFIYETQGFDRPARSWWVERVAEGVLFPLSDAALADSTNEPPNSA